MSVTHKRRTLQILGLFLILVGTILLIIGLIRMNTPIFCPAGGCSPDHLWWISVWALVPYYSGISLIVIGIALLIASRRVKSKSSQ